jgi:hypothetical protein
MAQLKNQDVTLKKFSSIKFKYKVWFSETQYATEGMVTSYDERTKKYEINTRHGIVRLNLSDIEVPTSITL